MFWNRKPEIMPFAVILFPGCAWLGPQLQDPAQYRIAIRAQGKASAASEWEPFGMRKGEKPPDEKGIYCLVATIDNARRGRRAESLARYEGNAVAVDVRYGCVTPRTRFF